MSAHTRTGVVVAIDGPSGSGKPSTSREVAVRLGLRYLDTGAMYRAVTWLALERGIALDATHRLVVLATAAQLALSPDPGSPTISIEGTDVTSAVRGPEVTAAVSAVSAVPGVRSAMVARQRQIIGSGGIVRKIALDSIGIRAVNGVGGTYLHIRFDSISTGHTGPWIDSTSESGISTLILNIPDASPSQRGLVSDTTQVFTGAKSFQTTLAVGTADTATSTLQVNGSVGLATNLYTDANTHYDMTVAANAAYRTIIFNVTSISGGYTVTLPDATKIPGRVYTIKKIGKTDDGQLSNPVVISTSSAQTIDGDSGSFTIYNNFTAVTLQAQGGNWYLLK